MTGLNRNKKPFYYCLYDDEVNLYDEYGNETGGKLLMYHEAAEMKANISPATGQSNTEQFGTLDNYDKVIVTTDMDCPIDENSVLFIDKVPEYGDSVIIGYEESGTVLGDPVPIIYKPPLYDYIVRRVAKSLNSISIAVHKVKVS